MLGLDSVWVVFPGLEVRKRDVVIWWCNIFGFGI